MDALVTTAWLAEELGASDLSIVDATYFSGMGERDARTEYITAHIPGAVFMDLSTLVDSASDLPNTFPPAGTFARAMGSLGIGRDDRIVVYDNSPLGTAARAWFLLKTFGAQNVAMLDGGLAKWQAEGRETASGTAQPIKRSFEPRVDHTRLRTIDQMTVNVTSGAEQVLDARSPARFNGAEPDPRHDTAPGHIPGSKNLYYRELFDADGCWKRGDALRDAFLRAGVDLDRPVVTTCGSGITASVLAFGLHLLGRDAALYDGSWSEWGSDPSTPKALGEP